MTESWALIIAAGITGVVSLIGIAVREFRQMKIKNSEDHGAVMGKLNDVQQGIKNVAERLDDHIDWHLKK